MTEAKRTNIYHVAFDGFAGLSEQANGDLSRQVISATRPLFSATRENTGKIVFRNDVTNIVLSRIWDQLLRQNREKVARGGYFRLSMQDITTNGAQVSAVSFVKCYITEVELSPLDQLSPEAQRIELSYSYSHNDVSLIGFNAF